MAELTWPHTHTNLSQRLIGLRPPCLRATLLWQAPSGKHKQGEHTTCQGAQTSAPGLSPQRPGDLDLPQRVWDRHTASLNNFYDEPRCVLKNQGLCEYSVLFLKMACKPQGLRMTFGKLLWSPTLTPTQLPALDNSILEKPFCLSLGPGGHFGSTRPLVPG